MYRWDLLGVLATGTRDECPAMETHSRPMKTLMSLELEYW